MRKSVRLLILLSYAIIAFASASFAQDGDVRWSVKTKDLGDNTFEVIFNAGISKTWHMYDLGPYDDMGPIPTVFSFEDSKDLNLIGKTYMIGEPIKVFDDIFGMEIGYFENSATFAQKVRLVSDEATLKGYVEWMICNDTGCSPPQEWEFAVNLKAATPTSKETQGAGAEVAVSVENNTDTGADNAEADTEEGTISAPADLSTTASEAVVNANSVDTRSIWSLIVEAIIWGLLAIVTPCVFPMVPMTVSFFMKGSENKTKGRVRAGMYGLFIVVLYTLPIAAIIVTTLLVGGKSVTADIFNWLATHWIPNVLFFIIFIIFAAAFFGAFELKMPGKLINRSDAKAEKNGLGGVFFMALTLVLVSFSCTGPLVGNVLIRSTQGEFWAPILTMLAFSITFALPFTLFALFPSWLNRLPKSGGWLNSVKVSLGFIEIALGLKFLSIADQTYHWGILDREIYLAIWIVVFTLLGFYLLGKLKFKYDSDVKYISVTRLTLSLIVFSFVVYMIPGMWGAPLKGLSGYVPPIHSQDFVVLNVRDQAMVSKFIGKGSDGGNSVDRKYADVLHMAHDLEGFFTYDEAFGHARKVNKPLFIDFTGHGCVNCREMEARVWSDSEVLRLLREEFVIAALYSDDKLEALEEDWITTPSGRVLKGVGKINSYIANEVFGVNAQPTYMIIGRDGKPLVPPRGYNLDIQEYVKFLKSGIEAYENQK